VRRPQPTAAARRGQRGLAEFPRSSSPNSHAADPLAVEYAKDPGRDLERSDPGAATDDEPRSTYPLRAPRPAASGRTPLAHQDRMPLLAKYLAAPAAADHAGDKAEDIH